MKDGSDEYRIAWYLHAQGIPTSTDDFGNVMPIVYILAYDGYWFVIMPRRGDHPARPFARRMQEIFKFIRCRLRAKYVHPCLTFSNLFQGLSFVHKHKIVHGAERGVHECVASRITVAKLLGMLGIMFCQTFTHITPKTPMLAPLFDRVITWDIMISKHSTAPEALRFFEDQVYPHTTESELEIIATDCDQEKWAAFREPRISPRTRILRSICAHTSCHSVVAYVWRIFQFVHRLLCL